MDPRFTEWLKSNLISESHFMIINFNIIIIKIIENGKWAV